MEGDACVYESTACLLWLLEQHGALPAAGFGPCV
jgi:hypothetical protein